MGGILSATLIDRYGWSGVFVLGALAPLALAPMIYLFLPESLQMLIAKKAPREQVVAVLSKVIGAKNVPADAVFVFDTETPVHARPKDLFRPDLRLGSLLIGLLFFSTLMLAYFLVNWTPLLLRQTGLPVHLAIYGTVLLNFGGILGSLAISRLSDRIGISRVLPVTYVLGALAVAAIGMVGNASAVTLLVVFLAGALCLGAQLTAIALVALFYPPFLCATGIGWTMAVGRVGSFLGPIGAGLLISAGLSMAGLFWIATIPALVSAGAIVLLGLNRKPYNSAVASPAWPASQKPG